MSQHGSTRHKTATVSEWYLFYFLAKIAHSYTAIYLTLEVVIRRSCQIQQSVSHSTIQQKRLFQYAREKDDCDSTGDVARKFSTIDGSSQSYFGITHKSKVVEGKKKGAKAVRTCGVCQEQGHFYNICGEIERRGYSLGKTKAKTSNWEASVTREVREDYATVVEEETGLIVHSELSPKKAAKNLVVLVIHGRVNQKGDTYVVELIYNPFHAKNSGDFYELASDAITRILRCKNSDIVVIAN